MRGGAVLVLVIGMIKEGKSESLRGYRVYSSCGSWRPSSGSGSGWGGEEFTVRSLSVIRLYDWAAACEPTRGPSFRRSVEGPRFSTCSPRKASR